MPRKKHRHRADGEHSSLDISFNRTATNDGPPEEIRTSRYPLPLLGRSQFASEPTLTPAYIGEFRSSESDTAASRLSSRFVLKIETSAMSCTGFSGGTGQRAELEVAERAIELAGEGVAQVPRDDDSTVRPHIEVISVQRVAGKYRARRSECMLSLLASFCCCCHVMPVS